MPDFTQLKQMQALAWSAARKHYESLRQPDGSFLDEREYLLVTGTRR